MKEGSEEGRKEMDCWKREEEGGGGVGDRGKAAFVSTHDLPRAKAYGKFDYIYYTVCVSGKKRTHKHIAMTITIESAPRFRQTFNHIKDIYLCH